MNKISLSINEISNIFSKTTELSFLMSSIWYNRKTIWHWKLWSRSILRYTYLTNFHQIEGVEWLEKKNRDKYFFDTLYKGVYQCVYRYTYFVCAYPWNVYPFFEAWKIANMEIAIQNWICTENGWRYDINNIFQKHWWYHTESERFYEKLNA